MANTPSLFRQPSTTAATPTTPAAAPEKLNFIGAAVMKNGAVYFGEFKQETEDGPVTVAVPTPSGDVRTTRRLNRSQIESTRALAVPLVQKLAKIGPHVLAKFDLDRVAPESAAPPADTDASPQ